MSDKIHDSIREPAVAGAFYPSDAHDLRAAIEQCLGERAWAGEAPKAIVAPHAGLLYSGPVAGAAYDAVRAGAAGIKRVVLLGPSHRVHFTGLALPSSDAFRTPLGTVRVDEELRRKALEFPWASVRDDAHRWEHSLEAHLPFLQSILDDFSILPAVAGELRSEEVAVWINAVGGDSATLVLVSTDLSHFLDYETAQAVDRKTCDAILNFEWDGLSSEQACGHTPLRGLMRYARTENLKPRLLDLRNSGDTAGDRNRVVGYASIGYFKD